MCADVVINVPEELDLSHLRGRGLQPGEEELPEGEAPSDQASQPPGTTHVRLGAYKIPLIFGHVMMCVVELDEGVVMQLASMGFDIEGCKRAVFHTHNQGTSIHCTIPFRCMVFHLYLCLFSCYL